MGSVNSKIEENPLFRFLNRLKMLDISKISEIGGQWTVFEEKNCYDVNEKNVRREQ